MLEPSSLVTTPPPPTPAAPLPVPRVRAGSRIDAKALRTQIQQLLAGLDRADDRVRLLCQTAREHKIYMVLEDGRGRFFDSWWSFAVCAQPHGLGLDPGLLAELAKETADPRRRARLALERPLALQRRGVNRQPGTGVSNKFDIAASGTMSPANDTVKRPRLSGGEYTLQRLRRDFPHLLAKVATGELASIKQAALAAGLTRPMLTCRYEVMAVARMVAMRFSAEERCRLAKLLAHPETIEAPPGRNTAAWKRYTAGTRGAA